MTRLSAQANLGASFLRGGWQAYANNPALVPEGKYNVRLPGLYVDYYVSSLTLDDVLGQDSEGNTVIDSDALIDRLDEENIIREHQAIDPLGFGMRAGQWFFSFSYGWRERGLSFYPKALPEVIWDGNYPYIGQTQDISTDIEMSQYHAWSLGAAYATESGFSLGARLNILSGVYSFSIERQDLRLHTAEEDFALSVDADFLAHASGGFEYAGFDSIQVGWDPVNMDPGRLFGPNLGVSLDLGASYTKNRWTASLSLLGMGQITWKDEVANYTIQGLKTYTGMDVLDSLYAGSTSLGSVLDTLDASLGIEETQDKFRTSLPLRLYAGLGYTLNERWRFGALFYQEWQRDKTFPAAALSANMLVLPWLDLGLQYAWRASSFSNLGLNAQVRAGALRIMATTDNLPGLIAWDKSSSGNFQLGFNLVF